MIIYEALHNPMYHESAAETISLHRTLTGAYKAMREHRVNECVEHREFKLTFGNDRLVKFHRYDDFKWWGIRKRELGD